VSSEKDFLLPDYTPACPVHGRDRGRQGFQKGFHGLQGVLRSFRNPLNELMIKLKKGFVKQNLTLLVL